MPGVSSSSPHDSNKELAEVITNLATAIRGFRIDLDTGRRNTCLLPAEPAGRSQNDGLVVLKPASVQEETRTQLADLEARLSGFEKQLCERGQWHQPNATRTEQDTTSKSSRETHDPAPAIYDLEDLEHAVSLIEKAISPPKTTPTAYHSFAHLKWEWDAAWNEFYAALPSGNYIFLALWRFSSLMNEWYHCGQSHRSDLQPEEVSELLGCWDDWEWDDVWKQWYLAMPGEEGEVCRVYADTWTRGEWGGWTFVDQRVAVEEPV